MSLFCDFYQLSACTNHNNGSIYQERAKIFELWYRIYENVLTKQRQESFVILSRNLSESETICSCGKNSHNMNV